MNSTTWLKAAALSAIVLGTSAGTTACSTEITAEPAYYPPPTFVASTTPVYFEGRPHFWYNGRWYFRSGGGWSYYRAEPAYLYRQRTYYGPPAHAYFRVVP